MYLSLLTANLPEMTGRTSKRDADIETLTADSRQQCKNGLFFCIRGAKADAHDFAPQAIENGCRALVVERALPLSCPQIIVTDVRAAMARMAAAFYGHPERRLKLIGITGTKSKTTTT